MVEIGPRLPRLTQPLVERVGQLTVVELDRDLAARLRQHAQLKVVESDVLKVDFAALADELGARSCAWWATCPTTSPAHPVPPAAVRAPGGGPALHAAEGSGGPDGGGALDRRLRAPVGDAAVALRDGEACCSCRRSPSTRRPGWTARWCAWCRWRTPRWTRGCCRRWCRWPSRSAASCCATAWASGWSRRASAAVRRAAPGRGGAGGRVPAAVRGADAGHGRLLTRPQSRAVPGFFPSGRDAAAASQ